LNLPWRRLRQGRSGELRHPARRDLGRGRQELPAVAITGAIRHPGSGPAVPAAIPA